MHKYYYQAITVITFGLLLLGCNTKDIKLITKIDFTMTTSYEDNGFVKDPLATEIIVTPQVDHPDFYYFVKYEITEGEGYFVAADSTIVKAGEDILLDQEQEYSVNWNFIGTSPGSHTVIITGRDNFEKSKKETLTYTLKNIAIFWEAQTTIQTAKVNDTIPIRLELKNESDGRIATFERSIRIPLGSGKVLNSDKEVLILDKLEPIAEGVTELFFIPSIEGAATLFFDLMDSNGQEKGTSLSFGVIGASENLIPVANAIILDDGVNKGVAPFTVTFDGSGSTDDGTIVNYQWNFGDTTTVGEGATVTHTFETTGQFTVTLTVTDDKDASNANTDTNTVTIFVEETMNTDFMAIDDLAVAAGTIPIIIPVLENDQIATGIIATVAEITQPLNGTAEILADGTISYTANTGFQNNDKFTYTITNALGGSSSAEVVVNVVITDQLPIAVDDTITTMEDKPIAIPVLDNDMDPEEKPLTITATSTPANGTVIINVNGSITYTPTTGYVGEDTFTYTINDGLEGNDATAIVTVTVTDVNQPPVAVPDEAETPGNIAVVIDVLFNDSDPEEEPIFIKEITKLLNGTAVIEDGKIKYTPNKGFVGTDTFTYIVVDDPVGNETEGTVTIVVKERAIILIPDARFELALLDNNIDTDGEINGQIYRDDAEAATEISFGTPSCCSGDRSYKIKDLTGFESLINLEKFGAFRNTFPSIDFSNHLKLKEISTRDSNLGEINLSQNIALEILLVPGARFVELNLDNNINLINLDISLNDLESIDLSNSTKLKTIEISYNKLVTLDLSSQPNLESLKSNNNALSSLNLKSGNNLLLNTIDVTGNDNLTCIQVNDVTFAQNNTNWRKDAATFYSLDCSVPRETIPVPDANFEQYLIDNKLDSNTTPDGKMYKDEAEAVLEIKAGGNPGVTHPEIKTLSGIEFFTNLESIFMGQNGLKSLDVTKNLKLKKLELNFQSDFADLNLVNNILLEEIKLNNFRFSDPTKELDLSNNTMLNTIDIRTTTIPSFNIKNGNNSGIASLNIIISGGSGDSCIQVDDVSAASDNTNWNINTFFSYYSLDCSQPRATIAIPDVNFERFLLIKGFDRVEDGMAFKDEVERITELDFSTTDIANFEGIEFFTGLEKLVINNLRSTIDFSKNSKLIDLDITGYSRIIDVSRNRALTTIRIAEGGATTSIDFSNNTALRSIELVNNAIDAITLPVNTVIDNLRLNNNSLRTLDLSVVNALMAMNVVGNSNLTCIKVSDVAAANTNRNWVKDATPIYRTVCP